MGIEYTDESGNKHFLDLKKMQLPQNSGRNQTLINQVWGRLVREVEHELEQKNQRDPINNTDENPLKIVTDQKLLKIVRDLVTYTQQENDSVHLHKMQLLVSVLVLLACFALLTCGLLLPSIALALTVIALAPLWTFICTAMILKSIEARPGVPLDPGTKYRITSDFITFVTESDYTKKAAAKVTQLHNDSPMNNSPSSSDEDSALLLFRGNSGSNLHFFKASATNQHKEVQSSSESLQYNARSIIRVV
jgi:hypothetical protein